MSADSLTDSKKSAAIKKIRTALRELDKQDLPTTPLKVAAIALLLDKDPKTLYSARVTREEKLESKKTIHPLSLESIPYSGTPTQATYMALDVIEYLNRMALAPTLKGWEQALPQKYPALDVPRAFLGFQTWMSIADGTELWPFAMQPDGRPLELISAVLNGEVGDDIRWLTIREFGDLTAQVASNVFHGQEKVALKEVMDVAKEDPIDEKPPRDRWTKPGGPI